MLAYNDGHTVNFLMIVELADAGSGGVQECYYENT